MELSDVNYIPVRVNELPFKQSVDLSDNLLLARPVNGMEYSTIKVPYQALCANLYGDVYNALSNRISLSVLEEVSSLTSNTLEPSWVFGTRPVQDINIRLNIISGNYITRDTDQDINSRKTFNISPVVSNTDSISSVSSVANVEFVRNEIGRMGGSVAFSNDTSALLSVSYGNPNDSNAKNKMNLPTSNYHVYTVQNDCVLFVWVTSKAGAGGLSIKIGNEDRKTSGGLLVERFPDNDKEQWWTFTTRIPVKRGTYVKFVPDNKLWWLRSIIEYSALSASAE